MAARRPRPVEIVENLWAPWRMEYIAAAVRVRPPTCVFCDMLPAGDDRARLVLHRGSRAFVVMNRYPYNNGHLLVLPRQHVGSFDELELEVFEDLNDLMRRAVGAVKSALQPQGINLGMNLGETAGAGIPGHLHYHIVPRWNGDTNFMPVVGQTKVISQHLLDTYDQLKPFFDKLER